ncbi:MAG: type II toxin-antitoxin system RelE/ParE family toxin [Candidatus Symbiothrix sp.]|jgi:plasmid stabilization system protein ParE|nr:type II toxin-antitoxin system RelE/ParE family toxin [Candidatus Symbiothrix sp.]
MAPIIEWTQNAQKELNTVYDYLEENWTQREIVNFSRQLENILSIIIRFPFIYPSSKQRDTVRRCVISKQSSLYYQVNIEKEKIIILSFFDNRRNSNKLKI